MSIISSGGDSGKQQGHSAVGWLLWDPCSCLLCVTCGTKTSEILKRFLIASRLKTLTLIQLTFNDLAPTEPHSISAIKTSQLMLYREIIAVCSQVHTKHINTLCGQNVELYIKTQSVPHSKHTPSRL